MSEEVKRPLESQPAPEQAQAPEETPETKPIEEVEDKGPSRHLAKRNIAQDSRGRFISKKKPPAIVALEAEEKLKKPDTYAAQATKFMQKWLSQSDKPLSANSTRDEIMLHSLFTIVKAGKDEPKMASAAVQAAKEIWNRARGEAAKSELDREAMTAQSEQKIKVVLIRHPELMNPEPQKFEEQKPKKPSAEFLAKYGNGSKVIDAEIIETNPLALPPHHEGEN
jgi:hypothetical protein